MVACNNIPNTCGKVYDQNQLSVYVLNGLQVENVVYFFYQDLTTLTSFYTDEMVKIFHDYLYKVISINLKNTVFIFYAIILT